MSEQESRKRFREIASQAKWPPPLKCKALRANKYVCNEKSLIALVRTDNRVKGIEKALEIIGGIKPIIEGLDGYLLIKPNCNSDDPFPASTHPETLQFIVENLLKVGVSRDQIVIGDMSGPAWLPTRRTMRLNGTLSVAERFGVRVSFFEEEEWVAVKPEEASTWPRGFRIAKTVYDAYRIISLPCLKTHQFGGVFTLSLKNAVGIINPADRIHLHNSPKMRELIAEINLAYTADLIILDGVKCFISGGPAKGEEAEPGVIIAGGDRVAVDAVGVAVLKYFKAKDIANRKVHEHEQIKRAYEIGLGKMKIDEMKLKTVNLTDDEKFNELVEFVMRELK